MSSEVKCTKRLVNKSIPSFDIKKQPLMPSVCNDGYGFIRKFNFEISVTTISIVSSGAQKVAIVKSQTFLHPCG